MKNKHQWRNLVSPEGGSTDDFEVKLVVDQYTMSSLSVYYYNEKECPKIYLDSRLANVLAGYALIRKDLKFVKKAIRLSQSIEDKLTREKGDGKGYVFREEEDENADLLKGLYISFVVTYAKSFAQAHGRGVKLDAPEIFKNAPSKDLFKTHMELVEQRNQYIAHAGTTTLEQVRTVLLLDPERRPDSMPTLINDSVHANSWGKEKLAEFLCVVDYVDDRLTEILRRKSNALWEREIEPIPSHEWYNKIST